MRRDIAILPWMCIIFKGNYEEFSLGGAQVFWTHKKDKMSSFYPHIINKLYLSFAEEIY